MNNRQVTVHCPCGCDHFFQVPIQRQQAKGEGASYARDMTKLSPQHQLILDVLKWNGAFDELGGMTWDRILRACWQTAKDRQMKAPIPKGLSGRLSELLGAHLIESTPNIIELKDEETMQFRHRERRQQVYWLRREAPKMEVKLDENPMLGDVVKGMFAV